MPPVLVQTAGTQLTAFDGLILVVIAFSMLVGFVRGFLREAFGLVAWAGAAYLALQDFSWARDFVGQWIVEPKIQQLLAMAGVFCGALVILLMAVQWISYTVQGTMAQSVDRSLGLVFGLGRGLFFVCAGYLGSLFLVTPEFQPPIVRLSKSHPWLNQSALFLEKYIPSTLRSTPMLLKGLEMIRPLALPSQSLVNELSSPPPTLEELAPGATP
jgi:membrane protein required for colicin V production